MTPLWWAILAASVGAWATKLAGLSLPADWLEHDRVRRVTAVLPITMLAGLAAVALVDGGGTWRLDPALLVGTAAGIGVVVTDRAGVLGAFVTGAVATALVRLALGGA